MTLAVDEPSVDVLTQAANVQRKWVWTKFAKTGALIFSWICLGLYSEVLGPTLPTLMHQTKSNYEQIGIALAIRSSGLLSGSILGGWCADRWVHFRAFHIILALTFAALTNIVIPWTRSLAMLAFTMFVAGCTHGFLTTNGNPLLASIWVSEASGPFCIMHAGYGLGGAVAPVLVAPFTIVQTNTTGQNASNTLVQLQATTTNSTDHVIVDPVVPYNVVAATLLICACCFVPFGGCSRNTCSNCFGRGCQHIELAANTDEFTSSPTRRRLKCHRRILRFVSELVSRVSRTEFFIALCVFCIYFAIVGNERVFGKFMFTYAIYGPVGMNERNGYILNLIYWVCFGVARLITSFIALVVPAQVLLLFIAVGTLLASIGLIVIPPTQAWFYTITCIFGLFKSPLFPATLAAINRSHEITGFLIIIINLGSAVGASLLQYAAGKLIQTYGQSAFPYLVFGSACVVMVTSTLLIGLLRSIGDRFNHAYYNAPKECIEINRLDGFVSLKEAPDKQAED